MSEHNPHHGHGDHDNNQVESSSIQPRPILMFLAILFVATAFVFVVVKGLDWGLKKFDAPNQEQAATQVETQSRKLPPSQMPLLQGAPGRDSTATSNVPTELPLEEMERVRKETNEKINDYGWVDKSAGVAHIPIDRAKEMMAEKGLAALPSAAITEEVQKAETTRKLVLNADSSGGRMIVNQQAASQPAPQMAQLPAQSQQPPPQPQHNSQQEKPQKH
ncbi:MAG: hypothetical protein JMDDDDMK_01737 [Acidobacteria bacterium]|nr:hypothetical protein [Acidobacteriota bacterium]